MQLKEASRIMGLVNEMTPKYEDVFNQWAHITVSDAQLKRLVQIVLAGTETLRKLKHGPEEEISTVFRNQVDDVLAYSVLNETQKLETTRGTLFGAYNAITGYFQNIRQYKDTDAKLKSILYTGTAHARVQKAFRLCEQFAKKGFEALEL